MSCALVAVLWLAAAPAPFYWPKPDVVEEIDVPDVIKADGVPVRLHVLRSKKGVGELLEIFGNAFVRAGFYVAPVQKRRVAEPHVTGLDRQGLISYSAILSPNADGTTTCLLGEAAMGKKRDVGAGADFAPLFPGATAVMRVDQEGARIVTFRARTTLDELTRFYDEQLKKAGYRRSGDQSGTYERDGVRLSVLPRSEREGDVSVVLVESVR